MLKTQFLEHQSLIYFLTLDLLIYLIMMKIFKYFQIFLVERHYYLPLIILQINEIILQIQIYKCHQVTY